MATRPTIQEIRKLAWSHVKYGWAKSPGSNRRDIEWTAEDTEIYNNEFDAEYASTRGLPTNCPDCGHSWKAHEPGTFVKSLCQECNCTKEKGESK